MYNFMTICVQGATLTKNIINHVEEDQHHCPICKGKQIYIGDTWVCTICDRINYEDILWCINNRSKKL